MDTDLAQEAIQAALTGDWQKAHRLNLQILKINPEDIDALNRLARSYAELGNFNKAKVVVKKVLNLDPFNTIALKASEKWKNLKKGETYKSKSSDAQMFLEEPGKTKIVCLLYLGESKLISKLDSGDEVKLNSHSHRLSVTTLDGKYIGRLPDDLSARLRKLISFGNVYQVCIKSIDRNEVKVFIKEVKRAPEVTDIPSFSSERIDYISFTAPELVHRKDYNEIPEEVEEE